MAPAAQEEQWYIMYAVPDVSEDFMKPPKFPNAVFTFNKVPLPSRLFVESSVASPAGLVEYPYIAAADRSGHLLLCGYASFGLAVYICDPFFRRTTGIFPHDGGFNCRHCVGLIRNHNRRLLMVADLTPCFFEEDVFFTLFCTVDLYSWVEKEPDCSKILDKQVWRGDGVLTHQGTDVSDPTVVYFLNQYDSVEDFHDEVIAATDRWCPELHEIGLEELEDGDDDASEMSEDLEGDGDDSETSGDLEDDSEISEDDAEEDGDD
uniref:DUF1618 domain-containing protein n=1 Tax=Aegilops tauschii TaxID=37682 RepID=M8C2R3_AEGTA